MYFYLKEPKKETSSILFKVYVVSEKKYFTYSTGISIDKSDWSFDSATPILKRGEGGKKNANIKAKIDRFAALYEKIISSTNLKILDVTRYLLKVEFDKEFKGTEIEKISQYPSDYFEEYLEEKKTSRIITQNSITKYKISYNTFKLFESNTRKYKFEEINEDLFPKYISFVRAEKDYLDSTMHRHFKFLKTFWLWVYRKAKKDASVFRSFTYSDRYVDNISLSEADLLSLEKLDLNGQEDIARDLFLVGCYSGQRFSDYSVFEKADVRGDMIVKIAKKTSTQAFIPLHSKLKRILLKYDYKLPKMKFTQDFNPIIQEVCRIAKFDEDLKVIEFRGFDRKVIAKKRHQMVSSHTARRTFITISLEKGMPEKIVMEVCGIKDVKTLHKYFKVNSKSISDAVNRVWD